MARLGGRFVATGSQVTDKKNWVVDAFEMPFATDEDRRPLADVVDSLALEPPNS